MTVPVAVSNRSVGRYQLIGQIGEGGMGVVYLAQAPQGQRVALKLLRPAIIGDEHGRARLAREVTSLRRIQSPLIAEIYDADPWGETPYLVMRYVPGPSLRDLVRERGVLGGPGLLRLAHGLARSLTVVHAADVLHRDVKPSNVLLDSGRPVLIDFGLAQLADDVTLTQAGWLLGTPGYLAPEILYGDGPSQAADVHAWAATVAFAATGHGPYGAGPQMAVLDRARRGEWDVSDVPEEVADVVAAGLRSDPANRPSAAQLVDWLDGRMAGVPEQIEEPPLGEGARTAVVQVQPWSPERAAGQDSEQPPEQVVAPTSRQSLAEPPPTDAPAPSTVTSTLRSTSTPVSESRSATNPPSEPEGSAIAERGRSAGIRDSVYWLSFGVLVVAATVALPLVALFGIFVLGWALRIVAALDETRSDWRASRGPRRGDGLRSLAVAPWLALRTLGEAAANGICVFAGAGAFVALAHYGPARLETAALVLGGVVACGLGSYGPFSGQARVGGRTVAAALPRSGLVVAVIVLLVLGVASGLFAAQQVAGTSYVLFGSG